MKNILSVLVLISLSACSTAPEQKSKFDQNVNCTARALDYLGKERTEIKISEAESKKLDRLKALMNSKVGEAQSCYTAHVDRPEIYHVCLLVGTDSKGVLSFIEVEDKANPLSRDFAKCLADVYGDLNYKSVPSTSVLQPFNFFPRR